MTAVPTRRTFIDVLPGRTGSRTVRRRQPRRKRQADAARRDRLLVYLPPCRGLRLGEGLRDHSARRSRRRQPAPLTLLYSAAVRLTSNPTPRLAKIVRLVCGCAGQELRVAPPARRSWLAYARVRARQAAWLHDWLHLRPSDPRDARSAETPAGHRTATRSSAATLSPQLRDVAWLPVLVDGKD